MKNINKISIFDFDKTLVRSPELEDIKIIYKQKTGKEWPYVGCWSKPESLDMELFDIPIIKDSIIDYTRELERDDTLLVLVTGRLRRLENEVKKVLNSHNLVFDEYHFNHGGSTLECKLNTFSKLLERYPQAKEVEIWDDRLDHIQYFELWGKTHCKKGDIEGFSVNAVINN